MRAWGKCSLSYVINRKRVNLTFSDSSRNFWHLDQNTSYNFPSSSSCSSGVIAVSSVINSSMRLSFCNYNIRIFRFYSLSLPRVIRILSLVFYPSWRWLSEGIWSRVQSILRKTCSDAPHIFQTLSSAISASCWKRLTFAVTESSLAALIPQASLVNLLYSVFSSSWLLKLCVASFLSDLLVPRKVTITPLKCCKHSDTCIDSLFRVFFLG